MKTLGWTFVNALQAAFLAAWSAFWISAALLALAVRRDPDVPLSMARTRWAPGLLRVAGVRLEVEIDGDVDFDQPHVYVMNHQSMIDIPVAFAVLRCNLRFIAKKVLSRVPFLGWYMSATGMIFVDRGSSETAIRSLRAAGERIRDGASILAFPEGTRSLDGNILPFKKGSFMVAMEAGVPVVPVAIEGAAQVCPSGTFRVRPGTIRVRVGAPIPTAPFRREDRDVFMSRVRESLIGLHRTIGGPAPAGPMLRSA